jgi:RND superfamily putative drug exporter
MGITVAVFQGILGDPGITFWLAPFLFVILVALGADYNIFIMSRIREEADAGHEIHIAVSRGITLTGRVITSAGLILAGTFAALLLAPLPNLRQIGFGVTIGILIDTFVVRSLLVPATTMLLGRWAFWPRPPGTNAPTDRADDNDLLDSPAAVEPAATPRTPAATPRRQPQTAGQR